jgi:hypothetical protein
LLLVAVSRFSSSSHRNRVPPIRTAPPNLSTGAATTAEMLYVFIYLFTRARLGGTVLPK